MTSIQMLHILNAGQLYREYLAAITELKPSDQYSQAFPILRPMIILLGTGAALAYLIAAFRRDAPNAPAQ